MQERKLIRKFTLDTEIYDVELPQKVLAALQAEPLETDQRLYYGVDLVFDMSVYQTREFFQYPLEKLPPCPPNRRERMSERERLQERLTAILSQQLSKVSDGLRGAGIDLSHGGIIGDDWKELHKVRVEFYEEGEKEYDKKGRLKKRMTVNSIMPNRPYIAKRLVEFLFEMAKKDMLEGKIKERERAEHTPHMVPAAELFRAVAQAVLLERRRKTEEEISALADRLRLHGELRSDWPLEIAGGERSAEGIPEELEIDCPEFLLYQEDKGGGWTLKKVESLAAAQARITKDGYNRKSTVRMAVLDHLRPRGFDLFADTGEGLVKVKKQDAPGRKDLRLSWKK